MVSKGDEGSMKRDRPKSEILISGDGEVGSVNASRVSKMSINMPSKSQSEI